MKVGRQRKDASARFSERLLGGLSPAAFIGLWLYCRHIPDSGKSPKSLRPFLLPPSPAPTTPVFFVTLRLGRRHIKERSRSFRYPRTILKSLRWILIGGSEWNADSGKRDRRRESLKPPKGRGGDAQASAGELRRRLEANKNLTRALLCKRGEREREREREKTSSPLKSYGKWPVRSRFSLCERHRWNTPAIVQARPMENMWTYRPCSCCRYFDKAFATSRKVKRGKLSWDYRDFVKLDNFLSNSNSI